MATRSIFDFVHLASSSPRRAQLLDQLGVAYRPLLPDDGEDVESLEAVRRGEDAATYVQRVTSAKLNAAVARQSRKRAADAPILAADTTVVVGSVVLGKPEDAQDARRMLQSLSGRSHRVMTAVAIHVPAAPSSTPGVISVLSVSRVHVSKLNPSDIDHYIASQESFGKAGAYAIQGRFARFVTRIDGSYSGIMGLPLHETALLLKRAGVVF
jgi:septum formation protein